jgi:hypothetical protein
MIRRLDEPNAVVARGVVVVKKLVLERRWPRDHRLAWSCSVFGGEFETQGAPGYRRIRGGVAPIASSAIRAN